MRFDQWNFGVKVFGCSEAGGSMHMIDESVEKVGLAVEEESSVLVVFDTRHLHLGLHMEHCVVAGSFAELRCMGF